MPPSGIERTARRYVPGAGAVAVERLGSGLVNESYRVARDGQRYSLRVPVPDAAELGLEREWECRVLELAGTEGLAPRIARCDPERGILVAHWVEGRAWTPEEARREENIEKIALLARRVHVLRAPAPPRSSSPAGWIAFYRDALARRGADPVPGAGRRSDLNAGVESHLAALAALPPAPAVLCHSDLHAQNLVAGPGGLVLLDWEYAHVSDAFWDLAGWTCNNDLSAKARRLLLDGYRGRQASAEDEMRLEHLVWLYDYVCVLWSDLYLTSRGTGADQGIRDRAGILAARLLRDSGGRAG